MQSQNVCAGVPNTCRNLVEFNGTEDPYFVQPNRLITGITKDAGGSAMGGCSVFLFNTTDPSKPWLSQSTVSDNSGNYSFAVDPTQYYWCVSYLTASPDITGATVNTLMGV